MDVSIVEKKLREAHFFLGHMRAQEGKAFGDRERYDFYLSAFLSASRSVIERLEQSKLPFARFFFRWRSSVWSRDLGRQERKAADRLIDFFRKDRNQEVHEAGSSRAEKEAWITVLDRTVQVFSPESPLAEMSVPAYFLTIDGVERRATEACAEYLGLLQRMVAKFKADHP